MCIRDRAAPAPGSAFGLGGGADAPAADRSRGYGVTPGRDAAARPAGSGSGDEVADAMSALPEDLKRRLGL